MGSPKVALGVHPRGEEEEDLAPRKRFKTSDLPLNATQRSAIDSLLHTFKKKGEYDVLRKKVWAQYLESEEKQRFNDSLNELAEAEIDRDSSFLSRERGKAATLMQGAVDRSNIYKDVELCLDRLITEHVDHILAATREIRVADIGEEAAAEEERLGNIPDEVYDKEAATRREARDKKQRQDDARKRREEEKEQLRLEAKEAEAELERLRKNDERIKASKKRKEEDRKRRAEEDENRRRQHEQQLKDNAERYTPSNRSRDPSQRGHRFAERFDGPADLTSQSPNTPKENKPITNPATLIDDSTLERLALERLHSEAKESAAKSNTKPHIERSASLEPPLRKSQALKSRSSNISPSKAGFLSPARSESIKPKLSFSATNVNREAPNGAELVPPQGPRSNSPASAHINGFSHRSESRHGGHRDGYQGSPLNPEHKSTNNSSMISLRDREASHVSRDERDVSSHGQGFARESTRDREQSRGYGRDDRYDRQDRNRPHRQEYEESRSSGQKRSHSRGYHHRDRDYHDRRHDRSRSPYKGSDTRARAAPESSRPEDERSVRNGHPARDPADIDRYMPSSSARARDGEREKYKREDDKEHHIKKESGGHGRNDGHYPDGRDIKGDIREREEGRGNDHHHQERSGDWRDDQRREHGRDERYNERRGSRTNESERAQEKSEEQPRDKRDERYHERRESRAHESERVQEKSEEQPRDKREEGHGKREREYHHRHGDHYRDRHDDNNRDYGREREREHGREDRYHHGRRNDHDRDRDRDLFRDRPKEGRDDGRERDRERERRDDGHGRERDRDRDRRKENVDIDRYVPSGPRSDSKRPPRERV
ncbi:MAG: hypothetical protein LQ350_006650 [Teloschistes chrysophthalmus]|nr:MAG: hypothetical protein LQ350_006650 [Niorma chrysophthalma]